MTNVGGGDGGTRLAVAEGVVLCEVRVGETTNKGRDNSGRARELPPETWEEQDGTSGAYMGDGYRLPRVNF